MISRQETLEGWAERVIVRWKEKQLTMGIMDSKSLWDSLAFEVSGSAAGDIEKVIFFYNFYGAFVDMGVGKGTDIGQVKDNSTSRRLEGRGLGNSRHPKRWYSKTIAGETARLAEIMAANYGDTAVARIMDELPKQIVMHL